MLNPGEGKSRQPNAGQITSYSGASLAVNVAATGGSGTHADWTIVLTNSAAAAGYQPPTGTGNVTGPGSATAGHLATYADDRQAARRRRHGRTLANLPALTAQYLATSAVMFGVNMINGTIVASVAASALTIAIKTLRRQRSIGERSGMVHVPRRHACERGIEHRKITAPLSVTVSAALDAGISERHAGAHLVGRGQQRRSCFVSSDQLPSIQC